MSKRIGIGLFLWLAACTVQADSLAGDEILSANTMQLGDSSWYLYRPTPRSPEIYDIDYMMERLRGDLQGFALRFSRSGDFALDIRFAPLSDRNDFIGPVYDMEIGATQLVLSFSF